jgi:predicted amidohydrolase YtcJ
VWAGANLLECDLHELSTAEEYLAEVARYAAEHPDLEWISGGGWMMAAFPGGTPTKDLLDAIVPDRPVYLPNRDGHGAWVNSRALARAGIDRFTPDPADGRIERDADGEPTGTPARGRGDAGEPAPA